MPILYIKIVLFLIEIKCEIRYLIISTLFDVYKFFLQTTEWIEVFYPLLFFRGILTTKQIIQRDSKHTKQIY